MSASDSSPLSAGVPPTASAAKLRAGPPLLLRFGRTLFALSLIAFGVLHFVYGDFVTRVVTHWPESIPARLVWVYLTGIILVAAGGAILSGIKSRLPLLIVATVLALSFLLLHLPAVIGDALIGGQWTMAGKALVLLGGCLAVAATVPDHAVRDRSGLTLLAGPLPFAVGRTCLALFMVLAGVQHFRWFEFVVTLVPAWMPGGGAFWTYAAGVLLVAGGFGMLLPRVRFQAALLSGVMIFLWVFMLHLPRAVSAVGSRANETTAVFEALGFSGLAFLYAANAWPGRDR